MRLSTLLVGASMLSIVLCTLHLTDDIVHGWEPGTLGNLYALPIFVVWLYGTLVLSDRVSGCIIMLVGSLLSLGIPIIHMSARDRHRKQGREHERLPLLRVEHPRARCHGVVRAGTVGAAAVDAT